MMGQSGRETLSKIASKAVEMEKELRKRNHVLPLGGQWHSSFFSSIISGKELLILLGLNYTNEYENKLLGH